MDCPQISVIIPTYNRLERLRKVIEAFSHQTVESTRFELVVVSDGSTDGTDEFLRALEPPFSLTAAFQANAGPAAARNRGVELARGEILIFVDDDVLAQPDLIEQHLLSHEQNQAPVVVIGPMLPPPDCRLSTFVRWEQAMLNKQYDAMSTGVFEPTYRQFYTGNASLRHDLLVAAGPFDERYRRAEDVELAYRLAKRGARFVFNESAIGAHHATRSFSAWLQIAHDYGVNDLALGRQQDSEAGLDVLRQHFAGRNFLIRVLTRSCVCRPGLLRTIQKPIRVTASLSYWLGLERLGHHALSSIYNAHYYDAMASQLGGRADFRRMFPSPTAYVSNHGPIASVARES